MLFPSFLLFLSPFSLFLSFFPSIKMVGGGGQLPLQNLGGGGACSPFAPPPLNTPLQFRLSHSFIRRSYICIDKMALLYSSMNTEYIYNQLRQHVFLICYTYIYYLYSIYFLNNIVRVRKVYNRFFTPTNKS